MAALRLRAPFLIRIVFLAATFAGLLLPARGALAHEQHTVPVRMSLSPETYELLFDFDVPSLMLSRTLNHGDPMDAAGRLRELSEAARKRALSQAERFFRINLRIEIDGKRQTPEIELPTFEGGPLGRLGETASDFRVRIGGAIPEAARAVQIAPGRAMGTVRLEAFNPAGTLLRRETVPGGMAAPPIEIPRDSGEIGAGPASGASRPPAALLRDHLAMGFGRLLTSGAEPMLFVVALLLLSPAWRPAGGQIGAYTLAWALTLGLAARGYLHVPEEVVGPMVAASFGVVALENVVTERLRVWRPSVVFGLGAVHGVAFSGAFTSAAGAGASSANPALALLGYGGGLALGLLLFVGAAWGLLGVAQWRGMDAGRVRRPVSGLLVAVALVWTVQRIAAGGA